MPIYEYKREDGTVFDYWQTMSDDKLVTCPTTGQPITRLISGGNGALLQPESTIKHRGRFINSKLAKELEKNPFYTSLEGKRNQIKNNVEAAKQRNAEATRKITGRITEI